MITFVSYLNGTETTRRTRACKIVMQDGQPHVRWGRRLIPVVDGEAHVYYRTIKALTWPEVEAEVRRRQSDAGID